MVVQDSSGEQTSLSSGPDDGHRQGCIPVWMERRMESAAFVRPVGITVSRTHQCSQTQSGDQRSVAMGPLPPQQSHFDSVRQLLRSSVYPSGGQDMLPPPHVPDQRSLRHDRQMGNRAASVLSARRGEQQSRRSVACQAGHRMAYPSRHCPHPLPRVGPTGSGPVCRSIQRGPPGLFLREPQCSAPGMELPVGIRVSSSPADSPNLSKLATTPAAILLISPWWPDAIWMGEAIALSLRPPVELPRPSLHQQSTKELRELRFVAWTLCANIALRVSLHRSPHSLPPPFATLLKEHTSLPGLPGSSGVTPTPWHWRTPQTSI